MVSHVGVFTRDRGTLCASEGEAPDSSRDEICRVPSRFDGYAWQGHHRWLE